MPAAATTAPLNPRYREDEFDFYLSDINARALIVAADEAVTPFDETPGPYAGPAYDAFQLLWQALAEAKETTGTIDRTAVFEALSSR